MPPALRLLSASAGGGENSDAAVDASDLYERNPGGCACRTAPGSKNDAGALIGAVVAALALGGRRRRPKAG